MGTGHCPSLARVVNGNGLLDKIVSFLNVIIVKKERTAKKKKKKKKNNGENKDIIIFSYIYLQSLTLLWFKARNMEHPNGNGL